MSDTERTALSNLSGLAEQINAEHAACERAAREGLAHALECGRLLAEVKSRIGHGGWLPWIKDNCTFSTRSAQAYMRIYGNRHALEPKAQRVAHLSFREAMKELSEPESATKRLQQATGAIQEKLDTARPQIEDLRRRAEQQAVTIADLRQVAEEAGQLQRELAELQIRGDRLAGAVGEELPADIKLTGTADVRSFIPPDGRHMMFLLAGGEEWLLVTPSNHANYYFVTYMEQVIDGASIVGTKRPMRRDATARLAKDVLGRWKGEEVYGFTSAEGMFAPPPWGFNRGLFKDEKEHMDAAVLGKR